MRSERFIPRTVLGILPALAVVFVLVRTLSAQEGDTPLSIEPSSTDVLAQPISSSGPSPSGEPIASAEGASFGAVHLRADGTLAGHVGVFDSSSARAGAQATISFVRNGEVVATAISDESGSFQVAGLQPGIYSVAVSSQSGFAAFVVQVFPYDEIASGAPSLWDITLVPTAEAGLFGLTGGNVAAGAPLGGAMLPSGFSGGGGGGGGGGGLGSIGGLLGAGGLAAGISALATEPRQETASPSEL